MESPEQDSEQRMDRPTCVKKIRQIYGLPDFDEAETRDLAANNEDVEIEDAAKTLPTSTLKRGTRVNSFWMENSLRTS